MVVDWILVLAIRFLLFDHKSLRGVRALLWKGGWVFQTLLKCSFCQGFWIGLVLAAITHVQPVSWDVLVFALTSGIVSYSWILWAYPRIEEAEEMALLISDPTQEKEYEDIRQI